MVATKGETPKRRWFRFSLRTLFVAVTAVCVWLAYSLNWVSQRHAALKSYAVHYLENPFHYPKPKAPAGLWLLGEEGIGDLVLPVDSPFDREKTQRLFPEADIHDRPPVPPPIPLLPPPPQRNETAMIFRERLVSSEFEVAFDQSPKERPPDAPVTAPPNHFFVMGDNPFNAVDSRKFGAIPFSTIIGRKL